MTTVIVAVLIVAGLCCLGFVVRDHRRTGRLQRRFGPEYQAAVAQHDGNARNARRALLQRERDLDGVEVRPLDPAAAERLRGRLHDLQEEFVDSPRSAVTGAVETMDRTLAATGHPGDPGDLQTVLRFRGEDVLRDYRRAHGAAAAPGDGRTSTEDLRAAFLSARNVCEALARDTARDRSDERAEPLGPRMNLRRAS
ncbi:hypothetical protein [Streptacidiphilus melanogenes]|uniref:hypothetical protein n=1 Tax=Streptacidiphilus melanogenes TaxID=411235 RepID=UPI0006949A0F|nr:hypothetical protein [Streptacidiphilus melanogenes]